MKSHYTLRSSLSVLQWEGDLISSLEHSSLDIIHGNFYPLFYSDAFDLCLARVPKHLVYAVICSKSGAKKEIPKSYSCCINTVL